LCISQNIRVETNLDFSVTGSICSVLDQAERREKAPQWGNTGCCPVIFHVYETALSGEVQIQTVRAAIPPEEVRVKLDMRLSHAEIKLAAQKPNSMKKAA